MYTQSGSQKGSILHHEICRPNEFNKLSQGSIWHSDSALQPPQHVTLKTGNLINLFQGEKKKKVIFHFGSFHQGNVAKIGFQSLELNQ